MLHWQEHTVVVGLKHKKSSLYEKNISPSPADSILHQILHQCCNCMIILCQIEGLVISFRGISVVLKVIVVSVGAWKQFWEGAPHMPAPLWGCGVPTALIAEWLVECQGRLMGIIRCISPTKGSTESQFVVSGQVTICEKEFQVPDQNRSYKALQIGRTSGQETLVVVVIDKIIIPLAFIQQV